MAQPVPYSPTTNFEDEATALVAGRSTIRPDALDAELANIALTLLGVLFDLSIIQRDDTELRDGIVKPASLATSVLALIGSATGSRWNPRGNWVTATVYARYDMVEQLFGSYLCLTDHTSGVFDTDQAAGKWMVISPGLFGIIASAVAYTPTGTVVESNAQAAISGVASRAVQKAANGADFANIVTTRSNLSVPSKAEMQRQAPAYCQATGTSDAILGAFTPAVTVLTSPLILFVEAASANSTATPTFKADGTAAKRIVQGANQPLVPGNIPGANFLMLLAYDVSIDRYVLVNPVQSSFQRERLAADRTYYVRVDGSDSNSGLLNTAGGAFLTIQHALNWARDNIDANYHKVVVQVGPGTYSEALVVGNVIGVNEGGWPTKELCLRGNVADCSLTTIDSGASICVTGVGVHAAWLTEGFTLDSQTAWFESDASSRLYIGKNIGTGNPTYGFISIYDSFIERVEAFTTDCTSMTYMDYADYNSVILAVSANTFTLSNVLALAGAFILSSSSSVVTIGNITFVGTATGPRFICQDGGGISTGSSSETYLPGSVNGTTAREGWYNAIDKKFKIVAATYDVSTTGALAITGAGFAPKFVEVRAAVNGSKAWSIGEYDGIISSCLESRAVAGADEVTTDTAHCGALLIGGSDLALLEGASLDPDGVTLTKSVAGSPTGTGTLILKFYR